MKLFFLGRGSEEYRTFLSIMASLPKYNVELMHIKTIRLITDMNAYICGSSLCHQQQVIIMSDFKDTKDNEEDGKEQVKTFDWLPGGHVALADGEYDAIIMVS